MKTEKYPVIKRQIAIDLMKLFKENGMDSLSIDDVMVTAAAPLVLLDMNVAQEEERKLLHVKKIDSFLKSKSILARYRNYDYDSIKEALTIEWLPMFTNLQEKKDFLREIKIIDHISDDGEVSFKDYLVSSYINMNYSLEYGTTPYSTSVKKNVSYSRIPKEKLTYAPVAEGLQQILQPYIEHYKANFGYAAHLERYKWTAVSLFQRLFNIDSDNLAANIKESMKHSGNLLAGPYYFPMSMLSQFAQHSKDETRLALKNLFDERQTLTERIESYLNFSQEILAKNKACGNFNQNDTHQQSVRAISVYLSLMYPNKYYMFKTYVWNDFKREVGFDYPPLTHFIDKLTGYYSICNQIRSVLLQDKELVQLHDNTYPDDISDYNLLTQDFIYYVAYHYPNLLDKNATD